MTSAAMTPGVAPRSSVTPARKFRGRVGVRRLTSDSSLISCHRAGAACSRPRFRRIGRVQPLAVRPPMTRARRRHRRPRPTPNP